MGKAANPGTGLFSGQWPTHITRDMGWFPIYRWLEKLLRKRVHTVAFEIGYVGNGKKRRLRGPEKVKKRPRRLELWQGLYRLRKNSPV